MENLLLISKTGAIIDVVALLIIIISIFFGAKNGFVKTFFSVFGGLLSLLFAVLLCSSVAKFAESEFGAVTSVAEWIEGGLRKIFGEALMDTTLSEANETGLAEAGVATWLLKIILSMKGSSEIPVDTTLNQIISPVFAYYIVAILCVIILYIIFRLIFFLVGEIVLRLHTITMIRITDGALGAILGIIRGIVIIDIILMIISVLPIGFFQSIAVEVDSTILTSFLSSCNIFGYIINTLLTGNLNDIINLSA